LAPRWRAWSGPGHGALHRCAAPIIDAFIAGTSISAQILMAQRRIENWAAWILVDIVAVALYFSRQLYSTSALYVLFLLLSVAA